MVLSVITFFGASFLSAGDAILYGLVCIASGIALGADLALPPAIIAGRIQTNNDQSRATQYYAILAFLPKLALALAAGLAFLALQQAGFQANHSNYDQALIMLLIIYAIIPCLIKLVAVALLWHLTQQQGHRHETI